MNQTSRWMALIALVGALACTMAKPAATESAILAVSLRPALEPPTALVGDRRIEWSDLHAQLAEAAGSQVLEDLVLGERLKAECTRRAVVIGANGPGDEQALLMKTLAAAARRPEGEGFGLLEQVRANRGLGPARFAGLLERNAMLRALVRADGPAEITADDLRLAHELKHGSRVRVRLILVAGETQAAEAVRRLKDESFSDVAGKLSIDPSSTRGGMIDPFSPEDPTFPAAIRRVVRELEVATTSSPVAVSWGDRQGYAIIKLEERIAASVDAPKLEAIEDELKAEISLVRERAAMDRLARRLIAESTVTVFDKSLGWSWERRGGQTGR